MLPAPCDHEEEERRHLAAMWERSAGEQSGPADSLKPAEILARLGPSRQRLHCRVGARAAPTPPSSHRPRTAPLDRSPCAQTHASAPPRYRATIWMRKCVNQHEKL